MSNAADGLPVFLGTFRRKADIISFSGSSILALDISGSGNTWALYTQVGTMVKI